MTQDHFSADSDRISNALDEIERTSPHQTDGEWLERLTVECAPLIAEWDVDESWLWADWPGRSEHYPHATDIGIDIVGRRLSDGKLIAIQCKSRQLDEGGRGAQVTKHELNSFIAASSDPIWAERWLVTNGAIRLADNAVATAATKPVKPVNIESDLRKQQGLNQSGHTEPCPHCDGSGDRRTRDCMQREAIETSVDLLQKHAAVTGKARGRIILPCGTGKSRIALRIIEELTQPGQVSAVLCPSIALVAQLRGEFLAHCKGSMNALAVCSDEGVAKDRDLGTNPTADLGHASASEVKGLVTTRADEIGKWLKTVSEGDRIGVIFGTYQSSHRIADALRMSGQEIQVIVADEAHRTAGLRRIAKIEDKLRDFTVCHDDGRFPAKYRVYQTATPRVYNTDGKTRTNQEWVVRDMADEAVFGPELYRQAYADAVAHGWLTDYRIIAIGVNDEDAYQTANALAAKHGKKLSTAHFLRGLALALVMGGALRSKRVEIRSSINFMNLIARSKEMTSALESEVVRSWVQRRLEADETGHDVARYRLEHLDAKSRVAEREYAKARLMGATDEHPHGVLNVGIFGEGVDAPSLSAVGFLEARRSPVDVIQAVGRVMRRSPNKEMGYIICPILIPPNTDAESWLRNSGPEDGWKELGQILLALRAHDSRIEDKLSDLMQLYLPPPPAEDVATMITIGGDNRRVQHYGHVGTTGSAESDVEKVLTGNARPKDVFRPLDEVVPGKTARDGTTSVMQPPGPMAERIISGKRRHDGSTELREAGTVKSKPAADGTPGPVDVDKSKKTGRKMVNGEVGRTINRRKRAEERKVRTEEHIRSLFDEIEDVGISVNLLARSGLARNRAERDVNILEDSIEEAKRCLMGDELDALLDRHFGLDLLDDKKRKEQADGCTIAALLLMNAAMLHQRIAVGGWLPGISGLDTIKSTPDAIDELYDQWNDITRHDFRPIIMPAIDIIKTVRKSGRREGLNRALRHLAGEAERIAENYADLGTDHAGPLFNKVMGNQASDGAYFTRPPPAALLARLTLDATSQDADWTSDTTWRDHRTIDLACGSGTLIAAMLADMKRRAGDQGASTKRLAELQKLAVEEVIAGLDFNPVSLQLAAAQMTAGNSDIAYKKMQLHQMPYGPERGRARVGSLELLGQSSIVPRIGQMDLDDVSLDSVQMQMSVDDPLLEDAVDAASNVRIVIMNPPFTNRSKMGEKFQKETQRRMRNTADALETELVWNDPELKELGDKNTIRPLFVALADKCLDPVDGILAMISPTIALTATSGQKERIVLANRFHIHTFLTCHQPGQINLSQNTAINESMIVAQRHEGTSPPTRIINLDRMPLDEREAADLHGCLSGCTTGPLPNGWGEVSEWPAERIEAGDWSAVAFRSPSLAVAAAQIASSESLPRLHELNMLPAATGRVLRGNFVMSAPGVPGSFPILKSKGADGQTRIRGIPDEHWIPKKSATLEGLVGGQRHPDTARILQKAGHLLITAGQRLSSARLTAVAGEISYVGNGWRPVSDMMPSQAMAAAVALNSTVGRLQLMRNPGRTLEFPTYSAEETANLRVPDLGNEHICKILADCWQRTADVKVPQFRDGECEVRQLWDEAVAEALGWDLEQLSELRHLLHDEPHVRGLGREQYGD